MPKRFLQTLLSLFFLKNKKPTYIFAFLKYLSTNAIGAKNGRVYFRFKDLNLLGNLGLLSGKVLELGSGSSTFYFLGHPNIHSVVSIEENDRYLSSFLRQKTRILISQREAHQHEGIFGSRYQRKFDTKKFNFIYVDGPTCESLDSSFALPCWDVIESNINPQAVYAIDARTATVLMLLERLSETHLLLPSHSFLRERIRYMQYLESSYGVDFRISQNTGSSPLFVRTSVFIPFSELPKVKNKYSDFQSITL